VLFACGGDEPGAGKSSPQVRAERRAYDGAPPVVPHQEFGADCTSCHDRHGMPVEGVGFAPPSPHEFTEGLSAISNCRQCHVFRNTDAVFRANAFAGRPQTFEGGDRMYEGAPPRIPHRVFMRENCLACHSGPAAREAIRCSHPERSNCQQCHAAVAAEGEFARR
jgi:cytochrome c-type protein NapB